MRNITENLQLINGGDYNSTQIVRGFYFSITGTPKNSNATATVEHDSTDSNGINVMSSLMKEFQGALNNFEFANVTLSIEEVISTRIETNNGNSNHT